MRPLSHFEFLLFLFISDRPHCFFFSGLGRGVGGSKFYLLLCTLPRALPLFFHPLSKRKPSWLLALPLPTLVKNWSWESLAW